MAEILEVKVPHSGSVENVEINEWLVEVGAEVGVDDTLADVSTDKVDTELVSPHAGRVVRLLFGDGDEVAVGTVVALIVATEVAEAEAEDAVRRYLDASAGQDGR
ncbi:biotin/lipoyl-containing protein [Rhodococcus triatomae]|nr:branched-chain alpha-keto acid dehydrogenase subunit E2 [Rhodococcus triatomae BKS 15-14]